MKSNKLALSQCQPENGGVGTSLKQGIKGAEGGRGLSEKGQGQKGKGAHASRSLKDSTSLMPAAPPGI